jgi:hypothetical protein
MIVPVNGEFAYECPDKRIVSATKEGKVAE